MEDDIISRTRRCAELAQMLLAADEEARYEELKDMREALLRLYYAVNLEEEMEACKALLTEDTSEEAVDAVHDAAEIVRAASDAAFGLIERYGASDAGFAAKIDKLRLDDADDGLFDLLCKLYKCEGIIRMAYRCARGIPLTALPTLCWTPGKAAYPKGLGALIRKASSNKQWT